MATPSSFAEWNEQAAQSPYSTGSGGGGSAGFGSGGGPSSFAEWNNLASQSEFALGSNAYLSNIAQRTAPYVSSQAPAYQQRGGVLGGFLEARRRMGQQTVAAQNYDPANDPTLGVRMKKGEFGGILGQFANMAFDIESRPNQVPIEVDNRFGPTQEQIELYGQYVKQDDGTWVNLRELAGKSTLTPGPDRTDFLGKRAPMAVDKAINKTGFVGRMFRAGIEGTGEGIEMSSQNFADLFAVEPVSEGSVVMQQEKDTPAERFGGLFKATLGGVVSPATIAGMGAFSAATETPYIGEGIRKGGEKVYDWTYWAAEKGSKKFIDKLPISNESKQALYAPIAEGVTDGLMALVPYVAFKGSNKAVKGGKEIKARRNDPIAHNVNLQKQLETYSRNLEKEVTKVQKQGRDINIKTAKEINNVVAKKSPVDTSPVIANIPTLNGPIRLQTSQSTVFKNLLKNREDINYKVVNDLGDGPDGKGIQAKYEWDPKTKQSTIITTSPEASQGLARQFGHNVELESSKKIYSDMDTVFPNYFQKAPSINSSLGAYAVSKLEGSATIKQINKKIDDLSSNFKSDIKALGKGETPVAQYAAAVQKVIDDPAKAYKKAPEFTDFIQYGLREAGTLPDMIRQRALDGGMSSISLHRGMQAASSAKALGDLRKVQEEAMRIASGEEKKQGSFYEGKEVPDTDVRKQRTSDGGVRKERTTEEPKIEKVKGVKESLTPLVNEARKYKSVDELAEALEKSENASPELQKAIDELPRGKEQTRAVLSKLYDTAKEVEKNKKTKQKRDKTKKETEQKSSRVFDRLKSEHPDMLEGETKYDVVNLKKDAEEAVRLISKDPEKAYKIAMGVEESGKVTSTAVNIAFAEKALESGDAKSYAQFVKNRSVAQTRRGQEIAAERGSVTNNSTSRYVKELVATRLEMLDKSNISELKEKLGKGSKKRRAIEKIDSEVQKAQKKLKAKEFDVKKAQALIDKLAC